MNSSQKISLNQATNDNLGGMKVGSGLSIDSDGTVNVVAEVPTMTTESKGTAKCGVGLKMNADAIQVDVGSGLKLKNNQVQVNIGSGLDMNESGQLCASEIPTMTSEVRGLAKVG